MIVGLMLLKQAQIRGASAWTVMIVICWCAALVFPALLLMGGEVQPLSQFYQPAVIGGLFVIGQICILLSIRWGDVSIAAPVQGVKVLIVPAFSMLLLGASFQATIWLAAVLAMAGVACVQVSGGKVDRSKIWISIVFALLASLAMSIFDLCIQMWAPVWKPGVFLPISFAFAALFSLVCLPWADPLPSWNRPERRHLLVWGGLCMAVQAIGMTFTVGTWGDATRVNIVYSMRGLWGVIIPWCITWLTTRNRQAATQHLAADWALAVSSRVMMMRLLGAMLIGVAVVIGIWT